MADCCGDPAAAAVYLRLRINLDSSKLRVGILLEQQSEEALDFTHTMTGSPEIDVISDNRQELIEKMQAGRIRGLVVIPVDFAQQMARPNDVAPIQAITDGSEPNTANFVQGYVEGIGKSGSNSGQKIVAIVETFDRRANPLLV